MFLKGEALSIIQLLIKNAVDEQTKTSAKNGIIISINEEEKIMPYVRYRKDGRYEAVISYKGEKYSVYDKNPDNLDEKIKAKLQNIQFRAKIKNIVIANKKKQKELDKSPTVSEYFKEWVDVFKLHSVTEKQYKDICRYIEKYIKPMFGKYKLKELTATIMQKELNKMPDTRTKEIVILYLNAGLQQAQDDYLIPINPAKRLNKVVREVEQKRAYTMQEQKLIWSRLQGSVLFDYYCIYLFTGIRKNEIRMIKKVDYDNNQIIVKKEKDKTGYKTIDLTSDMMGIIRKVYPVTIYPDNIYKMFKVMLDEIGVDGDIHKIRHTYVVNQQALGTPMKQIQEWVGHKSMQTTSNIYLNADKSITKEELLKLYNNMYYYYTQ